MNTEITNKWEKTGLLEGLNEFNRNKCATSLETTAVFLMGDLRKYIKVIDKLYDSDGFFAGSVLPVIRRLYSEGEGMPEKAPTLDIRTVMDDYYRFCLSKRELYKDLKNTPACDTDAEFCNLYMHHIVESYQ